MKMGNDWTLCLSYIFYAVSMTKEKPAFPENAISTWNSLLQHPYIGYFRIINIGNDHCFPAQNNVLFFGIYSRMYFLFLRYSLKSL